MIAPRKNVRAFLDAAKAADIPMSIATSTPSELVKLGLEANGLECYFSNITTTGEAGGPQRNMPTFTTCHSKYSWSTWERPFLRDPACGSSKMLYSG